VQGCYTVDDDAMLRGVAELHDAEDVFVEPSCAAALAGLVRLADAARAGDQVADRLLHTGTHVMWATGGGLVPEQERQALLTAGRDVPPHLGPLHMAASALRCAAVPEQTAIPDCQ
jgi:D-serine dehydratase